MMFYQLKPILQLEDFPVRVTVFSDGFHWKNQVNCGATFNSKEYSYLKDVISVLHEQKNRRMDRLKFTSGFMKYLTFTSILIHILHMMNTRECFSTAKQFQQYIVWWQPFNGPNLVDRLGWNIHLKSGENDEVYSVLIALIGHLRQQQTLVSKMRITCPKVADTRWMSMAS
ncbi:hypothetical protein BC833DRAFT_627213 [Globomyces pollinis-pini]|nr:hypothetical protein BC833DRAFT_627213 [Globomyces pollinis-pini]